MNGRKVIPSSLKQAFTLVELSIVLVILGLLVGGVLIGQSLIRASELRSVVTQQRGYLTAVHAFKDKYFGIPGDIGNATSFWGTASGGCPYGARTGTQTCNGDQNGFITQLERNTFWQHLANAGLIAGKFSGDLNANVPNVDIPKARSGEGYFSFPMNPADEAPVWTYRNGTVSGFQENYWITFGKDGMDTNESPFWGVGGVLLNEEAYNIDTKVDDGIANKGNVSADIKSVNEDAFDGTCSAYTLSDKTARCALGFKPY